MPSLIQPLSACKPRRRSERPDSGRRPSGRYDGRSDKTRLPPGGLARVPASQGSDTVVAAIEDPWGNGKERVYATVNRRVDVLEMERSHGRISEAAYRTGRTVQATFEKLGRLPSCNWEVAPGDRFTAQRSMVEQAMDRAGTIQRMVHAIQGRIGMIDTRLLRRVLGDRLSFAECAALQGKSGDKGLNYVARRFRDALEDLAEAWTVKGRLQPPADDKHLAAAATTDRRQAAAIAGGVTFERLQEELAALQAKRPRDLSRAEAAEMVALAARIEALRGQSEPSR